MSQKRILYIISSFGKGIGGHYVSLNSITEELKFKNKHKIIVFGKNPSPLVNADLFIKTNFYSFINSIIKGLNFTREFNPDIIHVFDQHALLLARIINLFIKKKIIMNLCGGPNPYKYFPLTNNLILFSEENYDFFSKFEKKYQNIYLIPNRVTPIEVDDKSILEIIDKNKINKDSIVILRITRIGKYYERSIKQTITLYEELKKINPFHILLIVGVVEDISYFDEIRKKHPDVIFETEKKFAVNANRLIDIADIVVGTGRSFMEACNLNKILYCPSTTFDIPCLVHEGNFDIAFYFNFSERTDFTVREFDYTKYNIDNLHSFYKNKYVELFSVENVVEKYDSIYDLTLEKAQHENKIDLLEHLLRFIKALGK